MLNNTKKQRLARRIALYAFLASVAWAVLSTGFILVFEYKTGKENVLARIEELGDTQSKSIGSSLWEMNNSMARVQLEGLARIPIVSRAEIIIDKGLVFESAGEADSFAQCRKFPLIHGIDRDAVLLGTLILCPDFNPLKNQMVRNGITVLATQVANSVAIAFVFFSLFYWMAGRHLARISAQAEVLTTATLADPITLERKRKDGKPDELDDLQRALNTMRCDLSRTVEELHDSEERFNLALESVSDAVWDWNTETDETFYSPKWFTMLGYDQDEFPHSHETWRKLVHPDDRDMAIDHVHTRLNQGRQFGVEFRMRTRGGGWRWILSRGRGVEKSSSGKFGRVVGTHVDITDRKMNEELLRKERDMMRRLMETSPAGILVAGPEGDLLFVNSQAEAILGRDPETMRSDDSWCVTDPDGSSTDDRNPAHAVVRRTLKPVFGLEQLIRRPDGESVHISINAAPILDARGEFDGMVCTLEDITARKRHEQELIEAKNAAEGANRAKTSFLANMSHELRTPINGVMGMLQLLQSTEQDQEQTEYTDMAKKSCVRLTRLLSDILDMSRIEAERMDIQEDTFELADALGAVEQMFMPAANQVGVDLRFTMHPGTDCSFVGDSARLQQILDNLVGNALKFTNSGSVVVEVQALGAHGAKKRRLLFSVSDTGIGIADDKIGELFEPFTQAEGSYRRSFQGAGLGLSIVKRLVLLMNGSACIVSDAGIGTTIYVCLSFPLAVTQRADKKTPGERTNGDVRELEALVVEDDVMSQEILATMLEKMGVRATVAKDGKEALEVLRGRDFDVVFMDVQMPVMDGVEATRAIRAGRAGEDKTGIPVIALTAYAMNGDKEKFMSEGMDNYLPKPVDMDKLRDVLDWMEKKCPV